MCNCRNAAHRPFKQTTIKNNRNNNSRSYTRKWETKNEVDSPCGIVKGCNELAKRDPFPGRCGKIGGKLFRHFVDKLCLSWNQKLKYWKNGDARVIFHKIRFHEDCLCTDSLFGQAYSLHHRPDYLPGTAINCVCKFRGALLWEFWSVELW